MKRLEHSEIRELCKAAIQQIVDEKRCETFGVSDVIEKVLAAYPELDRVRVEHAVKTCMRGDLALPWPGLPKSRAAGLTVPDETQYQGPRQPLRCPDDPARS